MGRIKTVLMKRIARKLIKEHDDKVSTDFEKNKELVQKYTTVSSQKIRNVVAGYVGRLKRLSAAGEKLPKKKVGGEDLSKFYQ